MSEQLIVASAVAVLGSVLVRSYLRSVQPPQVYAQDTPANRKAIQACGLLSRRYLPSYLGQSGLMSTMSAGNEGLPAICAPSGACAPELLKLADGGTVSLEWGRNRSSRKSLRPVVLLIPGLNNHSRSAYIQRAMDSLDAHGFAPVTLNIRGTGDLRLTSKRVGCADSWRDIPQVLAHLRQGMGDCARIFAIGYSMGGSILAKHLGVTKHNSGIDAAITVSAPLDLAANAARLESTTIGRLLNVALTSPIKLALLTQQTWLRANGVSMLSLLSATSLRQIEERSICVLHGYKDAEDYYAQSDPLGGLKDICIPLLVLHAADDPVTSAPVPVGDIRKNKHSITAVTKHGGHLGWDAKWLDALCARFLAHCDGRVVGSDLSHGGSERVKVDVSKTPMGAAKL